MFPVSKTDMKRFSFPFRIFPQYLPWWEHIPTLVFPPNLYPLLTFLLIRDFFCFFSLLSDRRPSPLT